jgi:hypothetical protein
MATDNVKAECLGWMSVPGTMTIRDEVLPLRECSWRFTRGERHCGLTFRNPQDDPADPEVSYRAHASQLARDLDMPLEEAVALLKGLEWPEDKVA